MSSRIERIRGLLKTARECHRDPDVEVSDLGFSAVRIARAILVTYDDQRELAAMHAARLALPPEVRADFEARVKAWYLTRPDELTAEREEIARCQ